MPEGRFERNFKFRNSKRNMIVHYFEVLASSGLDLLKSLNSSVGTLKLGPG
jgi:hypothetical protein